MAIILVLVLTRILARAFSPVQMPTLVAYIPSPPVTVACFHLVSHGMGIDNRNSIREVPGDANVNMRTGKKIVKHEETQTKRRYTSARVDQALRSRNWVAHSSSVNTSSPRFRRARRSFLALRASLEVSFFFSFDFSILLPIASY